MDESIGKRQLPPINEHEDVVIPTSGLHGGDISSQRIDDLDREALRDALARDEVLKAIDLGCGLGAQAFRFSMVGAEVTLVDIVDIQDRVDAMNGLFDIGRLDFVNKDARSLEDGDLPDRLDLIYSQRFIHYLRWDEAVSLFEWLGRRADSNARVYLSASGLQSELGDGYPDGDQPVETRFAKLSPSMAEKHGIYKAVCLYRPADLRRLFEETGFDVVRIYTSAFGNVKGVAER